MKVLLSWLKEFVNTKGSPEEISALLTMGGLEVENIEEQAGDYIFEISLTPNLGHCLSILGIARELATLAKLPLQRPARPAVQEGKENIHEMIAVAIEDQGQCLRYSARLLKGVKVGPSPDWLVKRLEAVGIRSINNIVDVTNYVMMELGQPLHAFDYDKIAGKKIRVTSQPLAASLTTLDEKSHDIPHGALLIGDAQKPLAFAGVMGGKDSSVTEETKNVLIESAHFTAQAVRKTSKLLHLRTESSQRFEKEVDAEGVLPALERATALMQELAGGQVAKGIVDVQKKPAAPSPIICRLARTNQMLGLALSLREIVLIFERLQIKVVREEEAAVHVLVPSFRNDLKTEIDLIEEVGRIYGYQNIPIKHPKHISSTVDHNPLFLFEREMRQRLFGEGLQECITCDLISPDLAELTAEAADPASWISVLQPASIDQSVLRTSLLPGLLQTVQLNFAHQNRDLALFEVGRIHYKDKEQYKEQSMLGILLSGLCAYTHFDPKTREVDFFDLKGKVENLLLSLSIQASFEPSHLHNFHPGRQARIKVGETIIGALGEIHPGRLHALGIDFRVYFAELSLHDLFHLKKKETLAQDLPQFPGSLRDWTLTVKEETPVGEILTLIEKNPSPLLEKAELIDIYRSPQLGGQKKNLTFRFYYLDRKKTLAFETVEAEHAKITQDVAKKLTHRVD